MNPRLWLMPSRTLFGHLLWYPAGQEWILGLCAPQAQHWVCCVPSKCRSQERVKSWVGARQPWRVGEGLRLGQTELSRLGDLVPTREPDGFVASCCAQYSGISWKSLKTSCRR